MKTIYHATIRRDAQTITPVTVPAYELAVLKDVFGDENVVTGGVAGQWRESEDEFDRLSRKYGQAAVEKVYGTKASGGLENAIERADRKESKANDAQAELLEKAKALGIQATKNWGIAKLQAAIDEAQNQE